MGPATPQQQWGSPKAAVSPGLFPQPQPQLTPWLNPQTASSVDPRIQPSLPPRGQLPWNMRPTSQVQTQPGLMPPTQQPDVSDLMRRFYGWGGNQGLNLMQ